jgi:hypothetical protein
MQAGAPARARLAAPPLRQNKRQELKALRTLRERCEALIARPVTMAAGDGEGHTHSSELSR